MILPSTNVQIVIAGYFFLLGFALGITSYFFSIFKALLQKKIVLLNIVNFIQTTFYGGLFLLLAYWLCSLQIKAYMALVFVGSLLATKGLLAKLFCAKYEPMVAKLKMFLLKISQSKLFVKLKK